MKKATTIIREIDNLEQELFTRFNSQQMKEAIEKEEKRKKLYDDGTGLISVIYEGVVNDIKLDSYLKEQKTKR